MFFSVVFGLPLRKYYVRDVTIDISIILVNFYVVLMWDCCGYPTYCVIVSIPCLMVTLIPS